MAEAHAKHDPFDPAHLFEHVQDSQSFDVPKFLVPSGKIQIPQPFSGEKTEAEGKAPVFGFDYKLTKFMIIEVVVALIMVVVFVRLAGRMRGSDVPRGRIWNMLEA